jgi:hypothetical protein
MKKLSQKELIRHLERRSNLIMIKGFALGVCIMLGMYVVNTQAFTIETNFTNAIQYIRSVFVTSDGKQSGTAIVSMNTGGKALAVNGESDFNGTMNMVGTLNVSGTLNAHLNELDPNWNAEKSGYYTKTQIEAKNYLTGEKDPLFSANS